MTIGVNCGHTVSGAGGGAIGFIEESKHTRLVGYALMEMLRKEGINVIDCTIDMAETQQEYLTKVVNLANGQKLDWFVSIHFNASASRGGHGTEVYTYQGKRYQEALNVCLNLEHMGFLNRSVKNGSNFYVIRKTQAKAMLIEVCFCDSKEDTNLYHSVGGARRIAKTICNAIVPYGIKDIETFIMGTSMATAQQLNALLLAGNPDAKDYLYLAPIYLEEGEAEGVRGDGAFCQALIETGYFRFNGDVKACQYNYAGLGATGGVSGVSFPDSKTGIRAQIQHLKAYASASSLMKECVDPRYKYVDKGCAPTFEQLSGKWAVPGYVGYADLEAAKQARDSYGDHIVQLLTKARCVNRC